MGGDYVLYITFFLVAATTAGILLASFSRRNKYGDVCDSWVAIIVAGCVLLAVFVPMSIITYVDAHVRLADLRAFAEAGRNNYNRAVWEAANTAVVHNHLPQDKIDAYFETVEALLEAGGVGDVTEVSNLVNLDNFQHSRMVVQLIAEYRDKLNWYNEEVQWFKRVHKCWFFDGVYPSLSTIEAELLDLPVPLKY